MKISNSAYARHRGVSEGAVRKALKRGQITKDAQGIDPAVADREWEANRGRCRRICAQRLYAESLYLEAFFAGLAGKKGVSDRECRVK